MTMFFPSTYPSSHSRRRNASTRAEKEDAEGAIRIPIRGVLAGCCAAAGKLSAKSKTPSVRRAMFFLIWFLSFLTFCSSPYAPCDYSSNHSIRPRQYIRGNRQADLLSCLEINNELKLF